MMAGGGKITIERNRFPSWIGRVSGCRRNTHLSLCSPQGANFAVKIRHHCGWCPKRQGLQAGPAHESRIYSGENLVAMTFWPASLK